jgi:hypothetical protein
MSRKTAGNRNGQTQSKSARFYCLTQFSHSTSYAAAHRLGPLSIPGEGLGLQSLG